MRFSFTTMMNDFFAKVMFRNFKYFKSIDWDNMTEEEWREIIVGLIEFNDPCLKQGKPDPKYQQFMRDTYGPAFPKKGGRKPKPKDELAPGKARLLSTVFTKQKMGNVKKITDTPGDVPFGVHAAKGKKGEKFLAWPVDAKGNALKGKALDAWMQISDDHSHHLSRADVKREFTDQTGKLLKPGSELPSVVWQYTNPTDNQLALTDATRFIYGLDAPKKSVRIVEKVSDYLDSASESESDSDSDSDSGRDYDTADEDADAASDGGEVAEAAFAAEAASAAAEAAAEAASKAKAVAKKSKKAKKPKKSKKPKKDKKGKKKKKKTKKDKDQDDH